VLAPPLVLTRAEIDRIVSVLDQTIPEICAEAGR
jgi:adenosylmethionine-8-amino-7-oxononanoate aminotransferase